MGLFSSIKNGAIFKNTDITVRKIGNSENPDYINSIIECEVYYDQWTLANRYNKAYDILNLIQNSTNSNHDYQNDLVKIFFSKIIRLAKKTKYSTKSFKWGFK